MTQNEVFDGLIHAKFDKGPMAGLLISGFVVDAIRMLRCLWEKLGLLGSAGRALGDVELLYIHQDTVVLRD